MQAPHLAHSRSSVMLVGPKGSCHPTTPSNSPGTIRSASLGRAACAPGPLSDCSRLSLCTPLGELRASRPVLRSHTGWGEGNRIWQDRASGSAEEQRDGASARRRGFRSRRGSGRKLPGVPQWPCLHRHSPPAPCSTIPVVWPPTSQSIMAASAPATSHSRHQGIE